MRAPDMPIGWPRAIAPPLTLTMSSGMPRWAIEATATAANAGRGLALYSGTSKGIFIRFSDRLWAWEESRVEVGIRVDSRANWTIPGALQKDQILDIGVPEDAGSDQFLEYLKVGNRIYLDDNGGRALGDWSLAGSRAALDAWGRCVHLIR